jgi:hypothetical protein
MPSEQPTQDRTYEPPAIERVVTADELLREAQYAGDGSGADNLNF